MAQTHRWQRDRFGWVSMVAVTLLAFYPISTSAQVAGDGTLGTQVNGSTIAPCTGNCIITNGALRGSNLFHSLRQFSLPNGDFAGFVTTPAIQNVIVRVTGVGQPFISNINGTIATVNANVTAINPTNFFLLNPNGIIFGPNASLLIGGSFLATTANRMQFADGTEFRTNDPAPLLTVSVPIGLQMGQAPGEIRMQGTFFSAGQTDSFSNFALVGGEILLDDTQIEAPARRIELAGLAGTGGIGISNNGNLVTLTNPTTASRSDISLTNQSLLLTSGDRGGDIQLWGKRVTASGGSQILAQTLGSLTGGDLVINASESVQVTGFLRVITNGQPDVQFSGLFVQTEGTGQGGNIVITAPNLQILDVGRVSTTTQGSGNGGNIIVNASDFVRVSGSIDEGRLGSDLFAQANSQATGKAGKISITTGQLLVQDGGQIGASTFGAGNGGEIEIAASDRVEVSGLSGIFAAQARFQATGNGGNIAISTPRLLLLNGGQLSATTIGQGNSGNLTVIASESILISGKFSANSSASLEFPSGLRTDSGLTSTANIVFTPGNAGNIRITTPSLVVQNDASIGSTAFSVGKGGQIDIQADQLWVQQGGSISSGTLGRGDAGDLTINSSELFVQDGAQVLSSSIGRGSGGKLTVNATQSIQIDNGIRVDSPTGLFSQTEGSGNAQDLIVNTRTLVLQNGGRIASGTIAGSLGNGGNLTVNASDTVLITGTTVDNRFSSGLFTQSDSAGNAGDLTINTSQLSIQERGLVSAATYGQGASGIIRVTADSLEATNGAQLSTLTAGKQDAGSIILSVRDRIFLSGTNTGLFANTDPGSTGNGGSIFVANPKTVTIQDQSRIAVGSQGSGTGGNISIQAGRLELRDRGSITAETASAQGGNITLDVKDLLLLRRNSLISATAGTAQAGGDGGNITIRAPFIIGVLGENSDITANAFTGSGGRVNITAQGIFGLKFQPKLTPFSDITASSQFGISGIVTLNLLNVDPSRGLVALPVALTDPSQQISQDCKPGSKATASSFVATGRGGIPLSPDEPLESRAVVTKWVVLPEEAREMGSRGEGEITQFKHPAPIVEAQGVIVGADGGVELVASKLTGDRANFWTEALTCRTTQGN